MNIQTWKKIVNSIYYIYVYDSILRLSNAYQFEQLNEVNLIIIISLNGGKKYVENKNV